MLEAHHRRVNNMSITSTVTVSSDPSSKNLLSSHTHALSNRSHIQNQAMNALLNRNQERSRGNSPFESPDGRTPRLVDQVIDRRLIDIKSPATDAVQRIDSNSSVLTETQNDCIGKIQRDLNKSKSEERLRQQAGEPTQPHQQSNHSGG